MTLARRLVAPRPWRCVGLAAMAAMLTGLGAGQPVAATSGETLYLAGPETATAIPGSILPDLVGRARMSASVPFPRTLPINAAAVRYRPLERLEQLVKSDLYPYFDLYLYVNKAPSGASAQHMYVYERMPNGNFHLRYRWPASTGRERQERYFTSTPTGVYKLDPGRFYTYYESRVWDGVPMPFAMFLDVSYSGGRSSGIAIHGTNSRRNLGYRASGGCIRLAMENARLLFSLIQSNYGGEVPKFAFNGGRTSQTGELRRSDQGDIVTENGYRVLLVIDNVM